MKIKIKPYYEKTLERHERDLERVSKGIASHLRFNPALGKYYIRIIESLKHYKGSKWAGKNFILEEWQKKLIYILAGWEYKDDDGDWVRRFIEVFIFIPRKNGKTILAEGFTIADLVARPEPGGEVYFFATKEEQAKIGWSGVDKMLRSHKELRKYVKTTGKTIIYSKTDTVIKPLGRDSKSEDGLNGSIGVCDEKHAHPDNSLYNVVKDSQAARKNPLMLTITTAGNNPAGVAHDDYEYSKKVLEGVIENDRFFAFIAEPPKKPDNDDDFYFKEEVWKAANPNYGVSINIDTFKQSAKNAKDRPELLNNFLTKSLNIWVNAEELYIPLDRWKSCKGKVDDTGKFTGGLDLSLRDDFSSFFKVYKKGDTVHVKGKYYIPIDNIDERARLLRVPLVSWVEQGYITATPGNTINYMYIYNDMIEDVDNMEALGYDIAKAKKLIKLFEEPIDTDTLLEFGEDIDPKKMDTYKDRYDNCIPVTQGFRYLSEPTIWFKNLVRSGKLVYDDPVLTWMVSNMTILQNAQNNVMPNKSHPTKKIDGVAAIINALALLIHRENEKKTSPYEKHGLRSLG